jgi:hypothetical protein
MTSVATSRRAVGRALALVCALASALPVACSSKPPRYAGLDTESGQYVELTRGAMASADTFAGRYTSPQEGELVLAQKSGVLWGSYCYQRAGNRVDGRLTGNSDGNLARFRFEECVRSAAAPSGCVWGEGFMFYDRPRFAGGLTRLFGQRSYLSWSRGPHGQARSYSRDSAPFAATRVEASTGGASTSASGAGHCADGVTP